MPYYEVPEEVMENDEKFLKWAEISIDIGHKTAKKKKVVPTEQVLLTL